MRDKTGWGALRSGAILSRRDAGPKVIYPYRSGCSAVRERGRSGNHSMLPRMPKFRSATLQYVGLHKRAHCATSLQIRHGRRYVAAPKSSICTTKHSKVFTGSKESRKSS